jgi:glycosyltransferase involved in cell wall biosynthesis
MRAGPHIAVDARMIGDGGVGTYLRALLPRLAHGRPDWRFTLLGDPAALTALRAPNVAVRSCTPRIYSLREQVAVPLRLPSDARVFWAPHYNVPLFRRSARLVVTVHDVAHLELPHGALERAYARFMFARVASDSAVILFVSEFSRDAMRRHFEPRGTCVVTPNAVDESWFSAREHAPGRPIAEPYFLYVGNWKRHKNVPALLRAFGRIADRVPHRLILVGRSEGLNADPSIARELAALDGRVSYLGEVDAPRVRQLVAHAEALVTASLYEGFGLPPLEAMAAGCPVVASRAASLPEVCGQAALYCDPRDDGDIATRLVEIATDRDRRATLVELGAKRAREFSWDVSAGRTLAAFEEAIA